MRDVEEMELLDFPFAEVISAEWALEVRRKSGGFVNSEKTEEASWLGADITA
ncbi:MAG: hypothetical protein GY696_37770 [Gammaproteobacteria bacterium]|nr:hypothetical protein [Gammaproteobacteria bacterium]